jgi:hypothetical protein
MQENDNMIDKVINSSFIKDSFDRIVLRYKNSQTNNIDNYQGIAKNENLFEEKSFMREEKKFIHSNKNIKKKYFSSVGNNNFMNNFCDEKCFEKFNKITKLLKEGKIDYNKINWEEVGGSNFNLIQNLVNYYYKMGFQNGLDNQSLNKTN